MRNKLKAYQNMATNETQNNLTIWYVLAIILAIFSFYYGIGSYPLLDNNEGLYASIAKNMLLTKSFIIPHLNCLPYLEKPPLLYWLLSGNFYLFGFTAFAARFVTVTSAFFICIALLMFGYKTKQTKESLIATIIFASSAGVIIIARTLYFDMLLTLWVTIALLSLYFCDQTNNKLALRLAYFAVALGILTKGLVALILVISTYFIYLLITKQLRKLSQCLDLPGILIFFAIVIPWHVAAAIQHPGFTWYYLVNEQILRFFSARIPHDYYEGPIYYYIPRIFIYLAPWSLLIPLFCYSWRNNFASTLKKFLWCWLLVPLVFFSISQAKANYYMIISMPALAYLLADKLVFIYANKKTQLLSTYLAAILILILGAAIIIPSCYKSTPIIMLLQPQFLFLTFYVVAAILLIYFQRKNFLPIIFLFAGTIIPLTFIGLHGADLLQNKTSAAAAGLFVKQHKYDSQFYLYQDFEKFSAIAFYGDQCLKIIDSHSNDLYYAQQQTKFSKNFLTIAQIKNQGNIRIILDKNKAGEFIKNSNIKIDQIIVLGNLVIMRPASNQTTNTTLQVINGTI